MPQRSYQINEIFYSLQGEGIRAGSANFFLRFSGCNQTCKKETHGFDCDTEFVSGRKMTFDDIMKEFSTLAPQCKSVICTGGEPALQLDKELVDQFHAAGFYVAIETNGSINIDGLGINWITVSPKVAEHAIRQKFANEVKYVRGYGQAIPKTVVDADHYLISPAFAGLDFDDRSLEWCVKLVKENPAWKLSIQQHKSWKIR